MINGVLSISSFLKELLQERRLCVCLLPTSKGVSPLFFQEI